MGPLLCLLALASLQVPWILCHSDCHSRAIPALGEHACHAAGAHPEAPPHGESCGCSGHHHGHGTSSDTPTHGHEPTDGEHIVVQVPALCAGEAVVLPVALGEFAILILQLTPLTPACLAAEVAHVLEEDPCPVPRASAVRLLL